uniref:Uncharacterized protein n=1 Tax=Cacopsylla melanoneura TaxID=428564 RepID=A0A8D8XSI5_9HEMI
MNRTSLTFTLRRGDQLMTARQWMVQGTRQCGLLYAGSMRVAMDSVTSTCGRLVTVERMMTVIVTVMLPVCGLSASILLSMMGRMHTMMKVVLVLWHLLSVMEPRTLTREWLPPTSTTNAPPLILVLLPRLQRLQEYSHSRWKPIPN